jgi:ubiquinone/menaquinone biosynthesis C-methylase UbiE
MSTTDVKDVVRERYAEAALRAEAGRYSDSSNAPSSCCGGDDKASLKLYDASQTDTLPDKAVLASLGCGNPTALAELKPGETVLDLGSGGGIDVLLSARRVGPSGKAYGLDMTDEMLALARENQQKAGVTNVEFLKGEIEAVPLPEASVDVVISNCVINLSGDKDKVFREAFRVLKPGGRFAVSDIVSRGEVPADIRNNMLLWAGCAAGALRDTEYSGQLANVGFTNVSIETTKIYTLEDGRAWFKDLGIDDDKIPPHIDGLFVSAFIRAQKPRS